MTNEYPQYRFFVEQEEKISNILFCWEKKKHLIWAVTLLPVMITVDEELVQELYKIAIDSK